MITKLILAGALLASGAAASAFRADGDEQPIKRYSRVPNFPVPLEFINDNGVQQNNVNAYLRPETYGWVSAQHLTWLDVREPVIDLGNPKLIGTDLVFALAVGVRWQYAFWGITPANGTLDGSFIVSMDTGNVLVDFNGAKDSQTAETVLRKAIFLDGDELVKRVAGDAMTAFFSKPENQAAVNSLVKRFQDQQSKRTLP
jgi:hypothetical protein